MDDLPKLLRAWADYLTEEVRVVPAAIKMTEAAQRIEDLEMAITDWCWAIVESEGVSFEDRITDEKSHAIIIEVLDRYIGPSKQEKS